MISKHHKTRKSKI